MKACDNAWIDETLHELTTHGSARFPFQYYDCLYGPDVQPGFPWHWHRDVEIVYVQSGVAHCIVGGERIVLHRGEGMFIQSGVIHSYEVPQSAEMLTLLFMPEFVAPERGPLYARYVEPMLAANLSHLTLRPGVPWQEEMLLAIVRLCDIARENRPTMELDAHTGVCALWSLLFSRRSEIATQSSAESATLAQARLRKMIVFLETHYEERVRLADVARAASVSVSEALRCFRNGLQTTPIDYLNRYRLSNACGRLSTTGQTVTEIAAECGFSGAAYFDRMFRRQYHISPSAYRRQNAR